jgi:hypothetical protein
MAETGRIVADAVKRGYRGFLSRIHPDFFVGDAKAQSTNVALIQQLERPLESILQSWLSERPALRLVDKSCQVEYFIKSSSSEYVLRRRLLSFSLQEPLMLPDHPKPLLFKLLATRSVLSLFEDANVAVEPEVGRFLSREVASHMTAENELEEKGKFGEYLLAEELNASQHRSLTSVIPRIMKMDFVRLDSSMRKEEKAEAIKSLCRCADHLEEAEARLGMQMPVLFISPSTVGAALTLDSVRLPPHFTPSSIIPNRQS